MLTFHGLRSGNTCSTSVVRARLTSCMMTSWPSLVRMMSFSMMSAPCFSASRTAARVFSGATPDAPRWATMSTSARGAAAAGWATKTVARTRSRAPSGAGRTRGSRFMSDSWGGGGPAPTLPTCARFDAFVHMVAAPARPRLCRSRDPGPAEPPTSAGGPPPPRGRWPGWPGPPRRPGGRTAWPGRPGRVARASWASASSAANALRVGPYQRRKKSTNASAEANRQVKVRSSTSRAVISSPNRSRRCCSVPHSIGDGTPAGGATWPATVRNSWPMKPSGVQLARAMVPPGRQARSSSSAAFWWSGANIDTEHRHHGVELAVAARQGLRVAVGERDLQPLGGSALPASLEQGRHVVDADDRAAEPGGGQRRVPAAGGDVQHPPAGAQVGRVDELLGDPDDAGGHRVVVTAGPGQLLTLLDGCEVGASGGRPSGS